VVYSPLAAVDWPSAVPAAKVLASLAALAVSCTAVAFIAFFALIAEVGPARATVITYVNPAVAVVLGVLVLSEQFTAAMGGAFALILGGSLLATRAGRTTAADTPAVAPAPASQSPVMQPPAPGDYQSAPPGAPG
jgi:drug/metabolite transporter (DMT)-like permease